MSRFLCALPTSVAIAVAVGLSGCTHRATERISGELALPPGIERVRIELDNGTLDVGLPLAEAPARQLSYQGGVRMDANSEGELEQLRGVAPELVAAPDPEDPKLLVVRGPRAPAGVQGMIAYEGNLRVDPSLAVEVVIRDNGHVTLVGRRASSRVRTRRGDLRFEDCSGGVEATTGQGNVIAYAHRGDLDVRSQSGDMQAFVDQPGERITLSTGKGTVQCCVPEDIECEIDARAEIGRIGNDFGFEVTKPSAYSSALVGRRGGSKTRVLLRTAAGHIAVRALDPR